MLSKETLITVPTAITALYSSAYSQAHCYISLYKNTHCNVHCCPALYRNTHSHFSCLLHSIQSQLACPLLSALYRNMHSNTHCHHCTTKEIQIHIPKAVLHSTQKHIHSHTAYCTLQKHVFTLPLRSCTLHKNTFPWLLPSLHSTERHIHMATVIFQYTELQCPLPTDLLHSTETYIHMPVAWFTLRSHIPTCPVKICHLQKHLFKWPLPIWPLQKHSNDHCYTELYRNTHSHVHCKLNSRETHIHMFTAKTALLIKHIYRHIAYLTVQKLNFTCLLLYCTLEKQTFRCPLPSLHSTLTQIHMPTSVPVSKEKHIHIATVILQFTDTKSHAHCHHCTLQ